MKTSVMMEYMARPQAMIQAMKESGLSRGAGMCDSASMAMKEIKMHLADCLASGKWLYMVEGSALM